MFYLKILMLIKVKFLRIIKDFIGILEYWKNGIPVK